MNASAVIVLAAAGVGLLAAWYVAITRLYRSQLLASQSDSVRATVAVIVGVVFVWPVALVGCGILLLKLIRVGQAPALPAADAAEPSLSA